MESSGLHGTTVFGVGTDLVEIVRIEQTLAGFGERFERRVFTPGERAYCRKKGSPAVHFAARFAAKEAFLKALGTGRSLGLRWKDVEVTKAPSGAPIIQLKDTVLAAVRQRGIVSWHISITHTAHHAFAFVVLEKGLGSAPGVDA